MLIFVDDYGLCFKTVILAKYDQNVFKLSLKMTRLCSTKLSCTPPLISYCCMSCILVWRPWITIIL